MPAFASRLALAALATAILLTACSQPAAQAPGKADPALSESDIAAAGPRPAIAIDENGTVSVDGWVPYGALVGPAADQPGDARAARVEVGVGQVSTMEEALQAVFDASNTTLGRNTGFHEVTALPSIDGDQGWLIAGLAKRDGKPQRFLALVGRYNATGGWYVSSFQAPEAVYHAWGGPTFFMEISGKSVKETLTPQLIASIRQTTPEQDVQIADMIITQSIQVLFAQMTATMGMVSSMQGLSADIQARTDCIMTSGCVPGVDNQGRTIMTFPND